MDLRKCFDATPWDSSGHSAFGLKRGQARFLALVFITVGVVLTDPPFGVVPGDFVNIFLAGWLSGFCECLSFNMALVLSYAVIGPLFFLFGIWVYPYHTGRLFNGYMRRGKDFLRKVVRNPVLLLVGFLLFWVMVGLYKTYFGVV